MSTKHTPGPGWSLHQWDFEARAIRSDSVRAEVSAILDTAADNAADTCMEERLARGAAAWETRYAEVLRATIYSLVDSREVTGATVRWFTARAAIAACEVQS